jgi:four helix bundle protein
MFLAADEENLRNLNGSYLVARRRVCLHESSLSVRSILRSASCVCADRLWNTGRAAMKSADQLFDSGTSTGANVFEAQGGQTKPDFLARLAISRKESWETIFWLRLAIATSIVTKDAVAWELDEAHQLKAMITAAIKTGQSSEARGDPGAPVNG